jgi:hypothetical protein
MLTRDRDAVNWKMLSRRCLILDAQLALDTGDSSSAVGKATRAVAMAKSITSGDSVGDRIWLAKAYRTLGDAYRRSGDAAQARSAWASALAALPSGSAERTYEIGERIEVLNRNGRSAEGRALAERMRSLGYRQLT